MESRGGSATLVGDHLTPSRAIAAGNFKVSATDLDIRLRIPTTTRWSQHALEGVQTYPVPAGGGVVFETVFDEDASGEGIYPFVTHSFVDAEKDAVGMIQVGTSKRFTTMSH